MITSIASLLRSYLSARLFHTPTLRPQDTSSPGHRGSYASPELTYFFNRCAFESVCLSPSVLRLTFASVSIFSRGFFALGISHSASRLGIILCETMNQTVKATQSATRGVELSWIYCISQAPRRGEQVKYGGTKVRPRLSQTEYSGPTDIALTIANTRRKRPYRYAPLCLTGLTPTIVNTAHFVFPGTSTLSLSPLRPSSRRSSRLPPLFPP